MATPHFPGAGRGTRARGALAPLLLAALVAAPARPGTMAAAESRPDAIAAAAACAPRLQAFFASDFKDQAYQQKAYRKVASAWKRPDGSPKPGGKTVVIVTISRDGTATPPALHLESGTESWDAAAVEALKKAPPFDPLPKTHSGPSVEVHFHFECAA